MQQTKTKKKFFYGWVIVFCCTLLVAAGTGIFVNCLGIFVKPVCEELGFDRGPFTLYSTIGGFVGMFAMLAYGELYRRYPQHIRKFIAPKLTSDTIKPVLPKGLLATIVFICDHPFPSERTVVITNLPPAIPSVPIRSKL